jgi:hypothetical protein
VNVGVVGALMVTLIVTVEAHCPADGVNVYVAVPTVAVDIAAFQVPVILLFDVVGKVAGVAF